MTDPVRRLRFYDGQLLTAADFRVEQEYHRQMRYLSNRLLGWGVVEGLEVRIVDGGTIRVTAGVAVDRLGRELVLAQDLTVDVSTAPPTCVVTARWEEFEEGRGSSTWLELPRIAAEPAEKATPESLILAGLTRPRKGRLIVDTAKRRPFRRRR